MSIPSRKAALEMLLEAGQRNPGPWVEHSLNVAKAAEAIAKAYTKLDAEKAYILGCLHDIGRREGKTKLRHIIDGYDYLMKKGCTECARICLTHSFLLKDVEEALAENDCTDAETAFIQDFITKINYDDYDHLIQLCDGLALPSSLCIIEKRLVQNAIKKGVNELSVYKWKKELELKTYFEEQIGQSIYRLLPEFADSIYQ
ncbi:HD domain-containing protein [Geosporobacter ferrireducens]|uniref:HD domain-containing protein n=1 Tax=Geosporobacter ferrireducens TaxID=1424294 RepID=UPI00139B55D2|nr:HD domain-containing protein [Geosporobacter ferrireducens]MTI54370.1 HD domain-containing protein [Geosporobacter ferrireducens]